MHFSISITHAFLWFLCSFSFPSFSSLFYLYFLPWLFLSPLSLFTTIAFYTVCHGRIYHFYPSKSIFTPQPLLARCGRPSKIAHWTVGCPATTTTLYWLHHTSFPNKNGLSCLLPLFVFTTLIWIRVNLLPHLSLWHASSGSSSYLLLLGERSSQQDIFPQKSLSGIPKIDSLSPHRQTTPFHTFDPWPTSDVLAGYK